MLGRMIAGTIETVQTLWVVLHVQLVREASLFIGWGGAQLRGGRRISDTSRREGEEFQTRCEGGRKILDFPRRGGAKNFRLGQFFSMFLKHNFFMFLGYLGHF